jgi:hypothetical protein
MMKKRLKTIWSSMNKRPVYSAWVLVWLLPVIFMGTILCASIALAKLDKSQFLGTWNKIFLKP